MKENINFITTEKRNKNTENIDKLNSLQIAELIWQEDKVIDNAIKNCLPKIGLAIETAFEKIKNNGRMIYIGAGSSGRIGVLDASEMPPTFGVSNKVIIALIAGGENALRNPVEKAEDSAEECVNDLKKLKLSSKDVVVGISASGRTPYVVGGLKYANSINAHTISLSTSKQSTISKISKISIEAITGSEVITGSTRMKSGTAQKRILNMLSTGVMIKLGKVYKNWMVDVMPSNEKLRNRCAKIVSEISGIPKDSAWKLLEKSNFSVKHAIIMNNKNINYQQADIILKKANGLLSNII